MVRKLRVAITKEPEARERSGMEHIGWLEVQPGKWLPLYEPAATEGKPSINTAEGWNALAERLGQ